MISYTLSLCQWFSKENDALCEAECSATTLHSTEQPRAVGADQRRPHYCEHCSVPTGSRGVSTRHTQPSSGFLQRHCNIARREMSTSPVTCAVSRTTANGMEDCQSLSSVRVSLKRSGLVPIDGTRLLNSIFFLLYNIVRGKDLVMRYSQEEKVETAPGACPCAYLRSARTLVGWVPCTARLSAK